jgi:hypothetical protein
MIERLTVSMAARLSPHHYYAIGAPIIDSLGENVGEQQVTIRMLHQTFREPKAGGDPFGHVRIRSLF